MSDSGQFQFKFILIGDSQVGKTSVLHRFVKNTFSPKYRPTIGADFFTYLLQIDGREVKLQVV